MENWASLPFTPNCTPHKVPTICYIVYIKFAELRRVSLLSFAKWADGCCESSIPAKQRKLWQWRYKSDSHCDNMHFVQTVASAYNTVEWCTMWNLFNWQRMTCWYLGPMLQICFKLAVMSLKMPCIWRSKNLIMHEQSFQMSYCGSLYHVYFLKKLKKSTKKRKSEIIQIETNLLHLYWISAWHSLSILT